MPSSVHDIQVLRTTEYSRRQLSPSPTGGVLMRRPPNCGAGHLELLACHVRILHGVRVYTWQCVTV